MTYFCDECGCETKEIRRENERTLCSKCFDMISFFNIFFKDRKMKVFVDVFPKNDSLYYNILVFDIVNEDFISRTVRSETKDLYEAKYDVILFICGFIQDHSSAVIYSDFKIMRNHFDDTYKKRSQKMRAKYYEIEKFIQQGLRIEFIEPEHNMARLCPQMFRFFHLFEDYNRKVSFQLKKGETRD